MTTNEHLREEEEEEEDGVEEAHSSTFIFFTLQNEPGFVVDVVG